MADVDETALPLPEYKCHKIVRAAKITVVTLDRDKARAEGRETDGSATLDLGNFGIQRVDHDYVRKHNPQVGGYFVVYKDGYLSFSPAEPFEDGYALVE